MEKYGEEGIILVVMVRLILGFGVGTTLKGCPVMGPNFVPKFGPTLYKVYAIAYRLGLMKAVGLLDWHMMTTYLEIQNGVQVEGAVKFNKTWDTFVPSVGIWENFID